MSDSSPMMQQYERIKAKHQDAILFFRMGDFYEMFRHDAVEASRLLSLTLTQRAGVTMCGIPYHASQNYIQRLLALGKKIAVCEQTSLPGKGKGIVERDVVQVLSPGTLIDDGYLGGAEPNWLVSFSKPSQDSFGIASMDMSTGELLTRLVSFDRIKEVTLQELASKLPKEILVQESLFRENPDIMGIFASRPDVLINRYPDWNYDPHDCHQRLCTIMGIQSLHAFGLGNRDHHLHALSALLLYAQDAARHSLDHVRTLRVVKEGGALLLDETSIRNLELIRNLRDGGKSLSLLWVLDQTQTPMGARLLRQWLLEPCNTKVAIDQRLLVTSALYHNQEVLGSLRKHLGKMYDVERLCARISLEKAGPKDCVALGRSLGAMEAIFALVGDLADIPPPDGTALDKAREAMELIASTLVDEPPYNVNDGACIRAGIDPRLDDLRALSKDSQAVLDAYLESEKLSNDLPGLKIKQNRIIGYYMELSRVQSTKVPAHFIRKHSTIHAERFSTTRLMELEDAIEHSGEEARLLEIGIFEDLRKRLMGFVPQILSLARRVSELDVFASFAWQATVGGYVRPNIVEGTDLHILGGRHPVVEACVEPGTFVPNDTGLGGDGASLMLLTGPNMAGKSTFLRQTALIVLMAHIGSFVPAESATIGLTDRIFCRVGASDNLAGGESTFLVEMHETAAILRGATKQSLIIMDEVGRGTSTRDGLSIAWAVLEFIVEKLRCRALFATHFHELTQQTYQGMANYSLAVHEGPRGVTFLRRVVEGPSDHSYGIHVAAIAGVPKEVCDRATEFLALIQGQSQDSLGPRMPDAPTPEQKQGSGAKNKVQTLDLFSPGDQIAQLLENLDLDSCSPLQALNTLAQWKKLL